jgi:hypothetical protein
MSGKKTEDELEAQLGREIDARLEDISSSLSARRSISSLKKEPYN